MIDNDADRTQNKTPAAQSARRGSQGLASVALRRKRIAFDHCV
jgi:hypothetical protein